MLLLRFLKETAGFFLFIAELFRQQKSSKTTTHKKEDSGCRIYRIKPYKLPNPIKYSASPQTLALKKGNFWIGTGDSDKGPTQTTGYWNGITPVTGGYSVYINRPSGEFAVYNPANDSELITVTRNISGTTFATGPSALNWYNSQTNYMCLNIDYPPIVTNGLVLNLDAGFTPSFPKI